MTKPKIRELKTRARILLQNRYGLFAMLTAILLGSQFLITSVLDYVFPYQLSGLNSILYFGCSLLTNMFYTILLAGSYRIYLNHMRGIPYTIRDLFFAFKSQPEHPAIYSVIPFLFSMLFTKILSWVLDGLFSSNPGVSLTIRLLVLILAGILTLWVTLTLSLSLYLYCDAPWKNAWEFMQESIQLMKGNRLRLLRLQLSFIGLELLNMLSLGVATLFIQPYLMLTQVLFYEHLITPEARTKENETSQSEEHDSSPGSSDTYQNMYCQDPADTYENIDCQNPSDNRDN